MRWLILEDSLASRKGHWFEYLDSFARDLPKLGDQMTLCITKDAEADICNHFSALPILPESICLKMSDGAPVWKRYARVPTHAWKTYRSIMRILQGVSPPEIVFVPTMTVHHLLGWYFLIKSVLRRWPETKVVLFFLGLPVRQSEAGAISDGSPTGYIMKLLLKGISNNVNSGKVILGVETEAMRDAAREAFGVSFRYFPAPVYAISQSEHQSQRLVMACYGAARHEKGSDYLVAAICEYLRRYPQNHVLFVFQWIDDFSRPDGSIAVIPEEICNHPQVEIIRRMFSDGEYEKRLQSTDILLLPYRKSSYGIRGSRVVLEAMTNGMPVVVTEETTLAEQAEKFGAAVQCRDGDVDSLVSAIREAEQNYKALKNLAEDRKASASDHFSVREFRSLLLQ